MRHTRLLAGLGLLAAAASPAQAVVDEPVRQALALEAKGAMADAFAMLAPLLATRAGDPDFDYTFGLAAADSGHGPAAILAFQRVLAVQPGHAQARAEIARVYAMAGDVDSAKRQFDTVLDDPSIPDPVRQRFNRIVRDLGRTQAGGGTSVSGFAEASAGHDSNINTATQLNSITLPLFANLGPASLTGTSTRQDSAFYGVEGGVSVENGVSRQTRLFGSLLGDLRDNTRNHAFDQATATATGGVAHTLDNHDVLSLSGQFQQFWLGGDSYRQVYGLIAQHTHRLAGGHALSFAAQWLRLDYRTDPLRDAERFALTGSYAGRYAYVALSGGKEETRRSVSNNLSNTFFGGRGSFERPVNETLAVFAAAGLEHRWNDAADPLFLKDRRDTQADVSIGLKLLVSKAAYLRPRLSYTRNFSNIDLYDYRRFSASVGLRAEF